MYNYDSAIIQGLSRTRVLRNTFYLLKNLATTMFEWHGLPDSVSARYLEEILFRNGYAVFFKDKSLGFLTLGCSITGLNVYEDPTYIQPISQAKTFERIPAQECVLVKANYDLMPTIDTTIRYATSVSKIDCARDVNIAAQKTPVLVLTDKRSSHTAKTLYEKWNADAPVIFGVEGSVDPNNFRVLKTDAPFVAGQLQDIKMSIMNEYLMALGVGKTGEDKRERLISSEVQQTEKQGNAYTNIMLAPRLEACKAINALWPDLNVSVSVRADIDSVMANYSVSNTNVNYTFGTTGNDKEDDG